MGLIEASHLHYGLLNHNLRPICIFVQVPIMNVALPFVWKSFPFIFSADVVALVGVYAWKVRQTAEGGGVAHAQRPVISGGDCLLMRAACYEGSRSSCRTSWALKGQ
jgi:hypothetical protein